MTTRAPTTANPGTLVFVTQLVAPDDPVLGFVIPQLRALARRFDHLVVIANEVVAVPGDLDAEVISLGKESGRRRGARLARYQSALFTVLRRRGPATLLAHMAPRYLTTAAVQTRLFRVPTMLWYAHPERNRDLAVAERLTDAVITTMPGTYPHPGPKVHVIGQAIDLERFKVTPVPAHRPRQLIAVGRTGPVKGYMAMLEAMALARADGADAELTIVGPATTDAERAHARELDGAIHDLHLEGTVRLHDGVPHDRIASLLVESTALVNLTAAGNGDKVVLEAMAAGRPVILSEGAFVDLFDGAALPLTGSAQPRDVAARIVRLAQAAPATLDEVGRLLRERVERGHSLESWVDAVADLVVRLHRRP